MRQLFTLFQTRFQSLAHRTATCTAFFVFNCTIILLSIGTSQAVPQATLFGPSPYLSPVDSPFVQSVVPDLVIYDFENGSPEMDGAVAIHRIPNFLTMVGGPGLTTDSVDSDDGIIGGSGQNGHSLFFGNDDAEAPGFDIFFFKEAGLYPTHVGFVWTDGSNLATPKIVTFYDADDIPIGEIGPVAIGDDNFLGGTAEDRFFGASFEGGISRLFFRSPDSTKAVEIDHIQFNFDPILLGDVNQDGVVNLLDVAVFVALISNNLFLPEADINMDGIVDLLDVAPFVQLLSGI